MKTPARYLVVAPEVNIRGNICLVRYRCNEPSEVAEYMNAHPDRPNLVVPLRTQSREECEALDATLKSMIKGPFRTWDAKLWASQRQKALAERN